MSPQGMEKKLLLVRCSVLDLRAVGLAGITSVIMCCTVLVPSNEMQKALRNPEVQGNFFPYIFLLQVWQNPVAPAALHRSVFSKPG